MTDEDLLTAFYRYDPIKGLILNRYGRSLGTSRSDGYRQISLGSGRAYLFHRVAFLLMTGRWPNGEIDHINGIKHDNRWCNIHEVTSSQNQQNKLMHRNGHITGITWSKKSQKWQVVVPKHYKDKLYERKTYLGVFKTRTDAFEAINQFYLCGKQKPKELSLKGFPNDFFTLH